VLSVELPAPNNRAARRHDLGRCWQAVDPSHAGKGSRRYRYYVTPRTACPVGSWRPASSRRSSKASSRGRLPPASCCACSNLPIGWKEQRHLLGFA